MPQILNLDAIQVETITIVKGGRTFDLRDNVPAEILLQRFRLTPERYGLTTDSTQLATTDLDAALGGVDRLKHDTVHLVGEIFRWSRPETTDDEIGALFSLDELFQVVALFSMRPGMASAPPQDAPPPPPTPANPS